MSTHNQPDQMMWRFDGYQLVLDEDGLHLRLSKSRSGFEQCEVLELIERFQRIREWLSDGFQAPQPPDREQVRAMGPGWAERRVIEDSIRALRAQLDTDTTDQPF